MVKKIPQRMCVVCRTRKEKKDLMRIVFNKEGQIHLDTKGKLPGRGAYLCYNELCLEKALKEGKVDYALKTKIKEDMKDELRKEMKHIIMGVQNAEKHE